MYQGLAPGRYNKPMGTTFPDDLIPPQFVHAYYGRAFSETSRRKMEGILGDGNCLFHALSFTLFKDEGLHSKIHSDITHDR